MSTPYSSAADSKSDVMRMVVGRGTEATRPTAGKPALLETTASRRKGNDSSEFQLVQFYEPRELVSLDRSDRPDSETVD
jgi:hypothetical protein